MRKFIFLILIAGIFSCKKYNEVKSLNKEIAGTWEFERFSGYPFNQPTLPPGNGRIIVIEEGGSFERKQHDTLVFHGSYILQRKKDCYERSSDITFSTNESSPGTYQYIEISDGKLSLTSPNCYQDGGTSYYRRLQ